MEPGCCELPRNSIGTARWMASLTLVDPTLPPDRCGKTASPLRQRTGEHAANGMLWTAVLKRPHPDLATAGQQRTCRFRRTGGFAAAFGRPVRLAFRGLSSVGIRASRRQVLPRRMEPILSWVFTFLGFSHFLP
jgi:hypothetical protein